MHYLFITFYVKIILWKKILGMLLLMIIFLYLKSNQNKQICQTRISRLVSATCMFNRWKRKKLNLELLEECFCCYLFIEDMTKNCWAIETHNKIKFYRFFKTLNKRKIFYDFTHVHFVLFFIKGHIFSEQENWKELKNKKQIGKNSNKTISLSSNLSIFKILL